MALRDETESPTRRLEIEVAIAGTFLHAVNPTDADGVPGILGLSVKKSIDNPVPVASIKVNRIPNWVNLGQFGRVGIALGYNGLGATIFEGFVQDRAHGEFDGIIHAAGNSFVLWRTVQIPPQPFGAITTKAAIEKVVAYATTRNPVLNIPATSNVDPDDSSYYTLHSTAELDRQTSAQMIQQIADVEHWVIWENNAGHVVFKDLHTPGDIAFRKLTTTAASSAWIIGQRSREDPTALRTRLTVLGGTITTGVPPNEVTTTPEKTASITPDVIGDIVELPADSFIDAEYSNSLIHDDARAADLAQAKLKVLTGIPRQVTMRIPGDPELDIGQTIDLDYPEKNLVAKFYIFGIEHRVEEKTGYTTILDLRGGEGFGADVAVIPSAAFIVRIDREVFNDDLYIFATFDASTSFAEGGGALTYNWSDNQSPEITTPDIESETAEIITVQLLPADISGDWKVSLTVTDDSNGLVSDTVPFTVDTSPAGTDVQIPAVFAALDNRQTATPDGGGNWYDRTDVGVIAVTARPPDGVLSGIAVFGQTDGTILKTTDFCQTALTQVKAASGGNADIHHMLWDYRNLNLVWAVDDDSRLYYSSDGGDTWSLYNDIGSELGLGAGATLRHIGLPRGGGVWVYGGDGAGNPIIAYDAVVDGHNWVALTLGGELDADLPAVSTSFRVVDAVDVGYGLTIACENADAGDSGVRPIYFNTDPFIPANWKRATGLPVGFTNARFVVGDSVAINFYVGKDDRSIWFTTDGEAYTERTNVFPADVTPHHAIWLPSFVHNLNTANVYLIACEDSTSPSQGIFKSADAMQTVQLVRPVSPFSTWPASSIGRMVAVGSPSAISGGDDQLLLVQSDIGSSPGVYARETAVLQGGAWALREDGVSASNDNITNVKKLGDNHYRVLNMNSNSNIYISGELGQLQRSSDGGQTWVNVGPSPIVIASIDWGVIDVDIAPDGTLYLVATNVTGGTTSGLEPQVYKSIDDGITWGSAIFTHSDLESSNFIRFCSIACNPVNDQIIFVQGNTTIGISKQFYSLDGGSSFTETEGSATQSTGSGRKVIMWGNSRILHAVGNISDAVFYSDDFGVTWTSTGAAAAMDNGQFLTCLVRGSINGLAFALGGSSLDPQVIRTRDHGNTWENIFDGGADFENNITLFNTLIYDSSKDILYICGPVTAFERVRALSNASAILAGDVGSQSWRGLSYNIGSTFDGTGEIAPRGGALL